MGGSTALHARSRLAARLACAAALAGASTIALAAPSSASQQGAPRCSASQLAARAGRTGGAAGSVLAQFAFVNRGPGKCTLYGYPQVTLLDAAGRPLPTDDRDAAPGFDGVREQVVTLAKGEDAWFGIFFAARTGYGNLTCPTSAGLRLLAPQLKRAITLSGKPAQISPYGGSTTHLQCGKVALTPVSARPPSA